jgi:hypothetical protein
MRRHAATASSEPLLICLAPARERPSARFRLSSRIVVDRPIADVWRFLSDLPRVATWEQGVLVARQTSPRAPGVGTPLDVRRMYFGRETLIKCRITDWQEQRG